MKHSDTSVVSWGSRLAAILMWILPLLLLIPNIALDFTEIRYSFWCRMTNIFLPFGVYLLCAAFGPKIGRKILWFIPLMIICAFQIVLLFLYGESVIAIDMFLNVATTNYHEASELLLNLGPAIIVVLILYLPLISAGIWGVLSEIRIPARVLRIGRFAAVGALVVGVLSSVFAFSSSAGYRPARELFPFNAFCNMGLAAERSALTTRYPDTSAAYSFNVCDADTAAVDSCGARIIVAVVGETSRSNHWQLGGYERPTTPRLAARDGITFFSKALTESNTTHKSVPLMLSHLSADEFGDSIFSCLSIVDAFKQAGFTTAWISNQGHNHSFIDFYSGRADTVEYISDIRPDEPCPQDTELAPMLADFIASRPAGEKLFVVIHTYGSHFNYSERYLHSEAMFHPDDATEAACENRDCLVNAYDNSILATDKALDAIISTLESTGRPCAMLYAADHGEDIFDDDRERFLHASPCPTYYQIHVPMLVWLSPEFSRSHPGDYDALQKNASRNVSSSNSVFHTLVSLARLTMPVMNPAFALNSPLYTEPARRYLNDYNEGIPLKDSGLREQDFRCLEQRGISME